MGNLRVGFESPGYLLLLALLPLVWWIGRRTLRSLSRKQRFLAVGFRIAVLALIILSLAGAQLVRSNNRLTVLYVLDQSLSIPSVQRRAMVDFVNASVGAHMQADREDCVGVLTFGRTSEIEIPPLDYYPGLPPIEPLVEPQYTDLANALSQARVLFPRDSARRIVLVTDGNQNLGNAAIEAKSLADAGVSIDVVPIPLPARLEVAVEKLAAPAVAHKDEPFQLRPVLSVEAAPEDPPVAGMLRIVRNSFGRKETVIERQVELPPGKTVLTLTESLPRSGFFSYEVRFSPSDPQQDGTTRNNYATAYTQVQGKGKVLLIENGETPGEHDFLIEQLRSSGLEVELISTYSLFTSLVELQRFDCVVLADAPRASGDSGDNVTAFSDEQLQMLVENTETLGCGLVVLGGPNSYGAGGWADTPLERALPVDCKIKDARVAPVGALGLVIDRSGSMSGLKMQLSKAAAIAAVRSLGPRDFATVLAFDVGAIPVSPLGRVGDATRIAARISRLGANGGTDMYPAFKQAVAELALAKASVKHLVVLTDGQTRPGNFDELVRKAKQAKITISTVAVGDDAQVPLLSKIAAAAGGRFYAVRNPRAVPRIFMNEARRVASPLVRELDPPLQPIVVSQHPILSGQSDQFPPFSGFVMTSLKESPLVEVVLRSPAPAIDNNNTLLATWNYGIGKVVAFTSDDGSRWTTDWTAWDGYAPFYTKMIRWSMRPTNGSANYAVATNTEGDVTTIVIDALNDQSESINQQGGMSGTVVGPNSKQLPLAIEQVAPGRFAGRFESRDPGAYLVAIVPSGKDAGILRTGVNIGYSSEFRDREANLALLESIAGLQPRGGRPGHFVGGHDPQPLNLVARNLAAGIDADPYRRDLPKAIAIKAIWPLLVLAASCLFVGDIAVRRVHLNLAESRAALSRLTTRLLGRQPTADAEATLTRLRHRKAEVQSQFAAARQPPPEETAQEPAPANSPFDEAPAPPPSATEQPAALSEQQPPAEESYTARLLRAKREASRWKE